MKVDLKDVGSWEGNIILVQFESIKIGLLSKDSTFSVF